MNSPTTYPILALRDIARATMEITSFNVAKYDPSVGILNQLIELSYSPIHSFGDDIVLSKWGTLVKDDPKLLSMMTDIGVQVLLTLGADHRISEMEQVKLIFLSYTGVNVESMDKFSFIPEWLYAMIGISTIGADISKIIKTVKKPN